MEVIEIQNEIGNVVAKVSPERGFNLFSLMVDEIELLWSDTDFLAGSASASGSGTPILFPFPGRLKGKSYNYGGQEYHIDSDDGSGNAIHGFVLNRPWRVIETSKERIVGEFQPSIDDPGVLAQWPSDFIIRCTYEAQPDGISATYFIENPGELDLPCGLGTHAYFRVPVGQGIAEEAIVTCPVTERWTLEKLLATGNVECLDSSEPLGRGIRFGDITLDDVFSGVSFADGRATATISNPSSGKALLYTWDEACELCVIYTPPHREAICLEPYTLVPGGLAFETGEHGLIELKSGESFSHSMEIRLR
tara:strand:- start:1657 stop:2577 length:921 start_codon:yes stop_codon:yes gene_type:complete